MNDVVYTHVHTFPVDVSFGDDKDGILEAWKEICNFGRRVTYTGAETWANVLCDGMECWRIEDAPEITQQEISSS
jgi:hypothetical protein